MLAAFLVVDVWVIATAEAHADRYYNDEYQGNSDHTESDSRIVPEDSACEAVDQALLSRLGVGECAADNQEYEKNHGQRASHQIEEYLAFSRNLQPDLDHVEHHRNNR